MIALKDAPVGLFLFGETLCLKTEYLTDNKGAGIAQTDAYVVASGEYFWGGVSNPIARENLMVTPVVDTRHEQPSVDPRHIEVMKMMRDRLEQYKVLRDCMQLKDRSLDRAIFACDEVLRTNAVRSDTTSVGGE